MLENLSQAEAGRRLGLKERTVSNRLAEARRHLQRCLAKRGVELTAVLSAAALAAQPASALSPVMISTAIEAALATARGEGLAGIVSVSAIDLAQGAMSAALVSKAKMMAAVLLTAISLAGAGAWTCRTLTMSQAVHPSGGRQPPESGVSRGADAPRSEKRPGAAVNGRVVDPEGKPMRGAKLLFLPGFNGSSEKIPHKIWAVSGADGRFAFTVAKNQVDNEDSDEHWGYSYVLAAAEGHGFAAARLGRNGATDLTLRLVKDDVPIRGRVLDLQGKPVAGARVRIDGSLYTPEKGDLATWLAFLKDQNKKPDQAWDSHLTSLSSSAFDVFFPPVTTGADGRFRLSGIGRERVASLRIEGPTIAIQRVHAMTRPNETIRLLEDIDDPKKGTNPYFGAVFDLVAAPTRPIIGVVRDKDTGKPLAGVTVESQTIAHRFGLGVLRTTTDKDGRYQLLGLPKSNGNEIAAKTDEMPYLAANRKIANPLGLEPLTVNFGLKRGVWAKGRVTEKTTGKPVGATVSYLCFLDNPNAKEIFRLSPYYAERSTRQDGSFRIAALPGHGLLAARAWHDHYVMGVGAEQIKKGRIPESPDFFNTVPFHAIPTNYHTVAEIAPKPDEESITCNVALDPGHALKGTVLGPDGKPLAGARVSGLKDMGYWLNCGTDFTVESLRPNRPRVLQFVHEEKKLVGLLVLGGDEKEPLSVRLEPYGTLTGRLVTLQGEPLAGADVMCGADIKRKGQTLHPTALDVRTGKDGRFRIVGLMPGLKYGGLRVVKESQIRKIAGGEPKDLEIKPGGTKDLGDLKIKPLE